MKIKTDIQGISMMYSIERFKNSVNFCTERATAFVHEQPQLKRAKELFESTFQPIEAKIAVSAAGIFSLGIARISYLQRISNITQLVSSSTLPVNNNSKNKVSSQEIEPPQDSPASPQNLASTHAFEAISREQFPIGQITHSANSTPFDDTNEKHTFASLNQKNVYSFLIPMMLGGTVLAMTYLKSKRKAEKIKLHTVMRECINKNIPSNQQKTFKSFTTQDETNFLEVRRLRNEIILASRQKDLYTQKLVKKRCCSNVIRKIRKFKKENNGCVSKILNKIIGPSNKSLEASIHIQRNKIERLTNQVIEFENVFLKPFSNQSIRRPSNQIGRRGTLTAPIVTIYNPPVAAPSSNNTNKQRGNSCFIPSPAINLLDDVDLDDSAE